MSFIYTIRQEYQDKFPYRHLLYLSFDGIMLPYNENFQHLFAVTFHLCKSYLLSTYAICTFVVSLCRTFVEACIFFWLISQTFINNNKK